MPSFSTGLPTARSKNGMTQRPHQLRPSSQVLFLSCCGLASWRPDDGSLSSKASTQFNFSSFPKCGVGSKADWLEFELREEFQSAKSHNEFDAGDRGDPGFRFGSHCPDHKTCGTLQVASAIRRSRLVRSLAATFTAGHSCRCALLL